MEDVQQRLDCYLELRDEHQPEPEPSQFDTLEHLYTCFDKFKTLELYVCERKSGTCVCVKKVECLCDSDDYTKVMSTNLINASNNTLIVRFGFHPDFKTSQMQSIRFFTLDQEDEVSVMDICKTIKKDTKKRWYVESTLLLVDGKSYKVEGNPRIHRGDLHVSVQYMYWENTVT